MRTTADLEDIVAAAFPIDRVAPDSVATATFGMGCFWSSEARFGAVPGVVRTRVGFAGGDAEPTPDDRKDQTEVVQVDYDPEWLDYESLLEFFRTGHDPTVERERLGRSAILVHDDAQRDVADRAVERWEHEFESAVLTAVEPIDTLYLAPDEHQKYYLREHPDRLAELESAYTPAQLIDSTAAARYNAVLGGYGSTDSIGPAGELELAPPAPES